MLKKIIGIIPARYASSRFPGKPLAMIGNMSMIERVYRQASKSKKLSHVVVASDDERIIKHVIEFGGNAVMTSAHHQSGTDRCAEVINKETETWDIVVNVQGDEPFINPEQIDLLISCFEDGQTQIATIIKKINNAEDILNPNIVKVVTRLNNDAMYFSRSPIPFAVAAGDAAEHAYYSHTGIYGYLADVLKAISALKQSSLEIKESLEQLRWMENGFQIKTAISHHENKPVDTPDDLKKILASINT